MVRDKEVLYTFPLWAAHSCGERKKKKKFMLCFELQTKESALVMFNNRKLFSLITGQNSDDITQNPIQKVLPQPQNLKHLRYF